MCDRQSVKEKYINVTNIQKARKDWSSKEMVSRSRKGIHNSKCTVNKVWGTGVLGMGVWGMGYGGMEVLGFGVWGIGYGGMGNRVFGYGVWGMGVWRIGYWGMG